MMPLVPPLDPAMLEPRVLLWPLLFGLGLYLLVTGQPIGRPRPSLGERLRRLDVDERIRTELERREARPVFMSAALEGMLRPVLDDLGRLARAVLGRFGLGGGAELERSLAAVRPGVEPVQFFGEKVATGLLGFCLCPALAWLDVAPLGPWPVWLWGAAGAAGFLAPDWQLEAAIARRRTAALMELPALLDQLTIAVSAGLALEQALIQVARHASGVVAAELQRATREMALGQRTLVGALEAMGERGAVPELARLADQLRAASAQGLPLVQTLGAQAEALREQKRLRIIEEGGKATTRMVIPTALLIFPSLFLVLLVPAVVQVTNLGG
jgi:tight adherence protein C